MKLFNLVKKGVYSIAFCTLLFSKNANSQQLIENPQFPEMATALDNFVPLNWEIYEKALGDLNRDGNDDWVVLFKQQEETSYPNKKILLILFYNDSLKTFKKELVDYDMTNILTRDADLLECGFTLKIKNGYLNIGLYDPRPGVDRLIDYCFLFMKNQFLLLKETMQIQFLATGKKEKRTHRFTESKLLTISNFYYSDEISR